MKVYIASPFFNEEQLERVKFIEDKLKELNYDFFSPRLDTYVKPDSDNDARWKAFQDNLKGIKDSSFIIAVTDGKDVGTMFECGYAFSEGVSIIYFAETLGERPFNLMLAMSGDAVCKSRDELIKKLEEIKTSGIQLSLVNNTEFKGEIE
jgi:nucleoside 2-deoxyribosyltransferase